MIKHFVITGAVALAAFPGFAQTPTAEENFKKLTDFLPPSPNAASIIKNGELNVNGNNGVAGFNIGLLGLSSKSLGVNVSLSYSAAGIKVDEIASRAGMGWTLQAGGVVTRTLRGKPDELNTRRWPWSTFGINWASYNFMNSVSETPQTNSYDSEPDLFNFNAGGVSGSFVMNDAGQIVQNKETGIVIQTNFTSTEWNFKITAPNGIMYYFGGSGAKELSKRTSICGKNYDQFWPTAWYLKKMEEPNGNSISFEYSAISFDYETGVSQSASTAALVGQMMCNNIPCPGASYSSCANANYVQGVLLTGIVKNTDGSRINFTYTTRMDCDDKLLQRVELVNPASQTVKSYELLYDQVTGQNFTGNAGGLTAVNYTPYLKELRLWNNTNTAYQAHKFQYNDPGSRPQRLAYCQDHWGFFNGINNTTLIPTPLTAYERTALTLANANRNPDFNYAAKGILNRIQYPTGAVDSVVYEPNIFTGSGRASVHQTDCQVTGTGFSTQVVKSMAFTGEALYLEGGCIDNSGTGNFDPVHHKGTVEITNAAGTVLYSKLMTPGQNFSINFEQEGGITSGANQYYVKIYANGSVVTTWARLTFHPNTGTAPKPDVAGGLRVKTVLTSDGLGNINTKLYKYESLAGTGISSLLWYNQPVYRKQHLQMSFVQCTQSQNMGLLLPNDCNRVSYASNTQAGLFDFSGGPVSYNYVTEAADYRFTTGVTETKFGVTADAQGWHVWGPDNGYPPVNNVSSLMNGLELEKNIYRRNEANSTLEPVSKTSSVYNLYNLQQVLGYQVHRRGDNNLGAPTDTVTVITGPGCGNNNVACQVGLYNVDKYEFLSATVNMQSQQQTLYSQEAGGTPLVTATTNYYDANQPWLLTKTETQNSVNETTDTRFSYPVHNTGQTVYATMVQQNKTAAPVTVSGYKNGANEQTVIKTNFSNWGNGNLEPGSITRSVLGGAFENEGAISLRDAKGNILELTGRDGVVKSFIWGYNKEYPVAAVTGAGYNTAVAQLTVSLSTLETLSGTALLAETHKIRTGLPNAFVVTYTYIPHVGLKTETDAHNRTTTYEYDAYNQLTTVRDHDGNILKNIEYNYAGTGGHLLTPGANIYFNTAQSGSFTCQNCMPGYTGEAVSFTVPAGTYFSKTSQADANALAMEEVNARGQNNASLKGLCKSLTINNCYGVNKKVINCICETGIKVYTNQVQTGPNSWLCTYHYEWSDGSWSGNYTETSSQPCLMGGIEE